MDEPRVIIVAADTRADPHIVASAAAFGHRVLPVQTVNEAVVAVQREGTQVAAILSGIALKDGNWCDLVERLRILGCEAPVVLCSSQGSAETWWDALEHGVWEVVSPPVTVHALERILKDAPSGRHELGVVSATTGSSKKRPSGPWAGTTTPGV